MQDHSILAEFVETSAWFPMVDFIIENDVPINDIKLYPAAPDYAPEVFSNLFQCFALAVVQRKEPVHVTRHITKIGNQRLTIAWAEESSWFDVCLNSRTKQAHVNFYVNIPGPCYALMAAYLARDKSRIMQCLLSADTVLIGNPHNYDTALVEIREGLHQYYLLEKYINRPYALQLYAYVPYIKNKKKLITRGGVWRIILTPEASKNYQSYIEFSIQRQEWPGCFHNDVVVVNHHLL